MYKFNDNVVVASGFFKGLTGSLIDVRYCSTYTEYLVQLNVHGNTVWIKDSNIEKVNEIK